MSTSIEQTTSDMEYAAHLVTSGLRDPAFESRIRAEAERIREEILRQHGVLDIGVPAIRELRE